MGMRRCAGTMVRIDETSRFEHTSTKVAASVIQSAFDTDTDTARVGQKARPITSCGFRSHRPLANSFQYLIAPLR